MYRRSSKWLSVAVALLFIGVVKIDVAKAASAGEGKGKPVDVSVRVYNSIPISIPQPTIGATPTTLTFDSERWDTDDMHDPLTNPSRLTARTAGKYLIFANVIWSAARSGFRELSVILNGTTVIAYQTAGGQGSELPGAPPGVDLGPSHSLATHYQLEVGDYVEVRAYQASGDAVDILSVEAASPEFGMVKLP